MQTIVQITCTKGSSMRDLIANDTKLDNYNFNVLSEKKQGRSPGWASIRSTEHQGTLKIQWNASTYFLICRVINKGKGRPDQIIGAFIGYILKRHQKRVKLITILPD